MINLDEMEGASVDEDGNRDPGPLTSSYLTPLTKGSPQGEIQRQNTKMLPTSGWLGSSATTSLGKRATQRMATAHRSWQQA